MNFFNPFRSVPETKKSKAFSLHVQGANKPVWSKKNYKAYAVEGYEQNVIVNSAISRVSRAISSIEWQAQSDDKILPSHALLDLMRRPNPMQTRSSYWEQKIGYLMLSGNAYEERVRVGGKTTQLWNLRPDRMTPIASTTGMPSGYEYKVEQRKKIFPANRTTGVSDIRHLKLFNPLNDWVGMSPISAGAYAIDQHNESMNWVQSLLQNAARPSGALTLDSEASLSDEEFDRLKNEIETNHTGSDNAGRFMLLEGGLSWQAMGLSPVDMEILKVREMAARDISLAFGVPPLLLNIPGDNTYANYREARLGFYEDTILPLLDYLVQEFNSWISIPEHGSVRLVPDYDSIEAIAEKRQKLWQMADESFDITLNESRKMKNLPPLPTPLGNTLMAEIKRGGQSEPDSDSAAKAIETHLRETAYGR